jgi:hypothetical protein
LWAELLKPRPEIFGHPPADAESDPDDERDQGGHEDDEAA